MAKQKIDKKKFISVIVPAYKQEKTIKKDIIRIKKVLDQIRYNYEIIVVIDGILDKTFYNAKKIKNKKIKVIGYKNNRGKGHAVRFGMARAKGNIISFIDSGMDINPNGLSMLLEHLEWYMADIIVGSKLHPVSRVNYPFKRKILSIGYRILVRLLFGLNIRDTQVGIKFYRKKVLKDVLPRLLIKTYAFDIEILAVAHHLGYKRIYEAPVEIDFKKNSSVTSIMSSNFWKVIFCMLWDTLAVFYRLKILHYYNTGNKRKWRYDSELSFRVNIG